MITIKDIARILASQHGINAEDGELFVAQMVEVINNGLLSDRQVKIKGFGTFKLQTVKERNSVSVSTGERVTISEHDKVTFTPDSMMKDLINKPFSQFETVIIEDENLVLDDEFNTEKEEEEDNEKEEPIVATLIDNSTEINEIANNANDLEEASEETIAALAGTVVETVEEEVNDEQEDNDIISEDSDAENVQEEQSIKEETEEITDNEEASEDDNNEVEEEDTVEEEEKTEDEDVELVKDNVAEDSEASTETEEVKDEEIENDNEETKDTDTEEEEEEEENDDEEKEEEDDDDDDDDEEEDDDDDDDEYDDDEYDESERSPMFYGLVSGVVCSILFFIIGYYACLNGWFDSWLPAKEQAVAPVDTVSQNNQQVIPADTLVQKDSLNNTSKEEVKEEKESGTVSMDEYNKDTRVRTGAWVITGTKTEVTVKEGQTIKSISKSYFGPGMECYVEVYNDKKTVKAGDKIKIPELKLKKHIKK